MRHRVKVTVLDTKVHTDLQREYLANPESGPCPCLRRGDVYEFWREGGRDDFYHFGGDRRFPCAEAWDAISRSIYTGLQGGAFMHKWTNDDRVMIACCNDGTRPVIFKLERIDIPETEDERIYLDTRDFTCGRESAYGG